MESWDLRELCLPRQRWRCRHQLPLPHQLLLSLLRIPHQLPREEIQTTPATTPRIVRRQRMTTRRGTTPYCIMHSSEVALGYFSWLLRNTLLELGNTVYPMYVTHSWYEPPMGTYYMTRVRIRVRNHAGGGYISRTTHDFTTPHSMY
jgi:hypothetical protein